MKKEKKGAAATVTKHRSIASAGIEKFGKSSKKRKAYLIFTVVAAILVIAVAMVLRGVSDKKAYNNYMVVAQQSYAVSDFDSALSALRKASSIEKTEDCLMLMADCYESQGKYDKALEILRSMDIQNPVVSGKISSVESLRQTLSAAEKVTIAGKQFPASTTSLVLDDMGLTSSIFTEIVQLYSVDNLSISGNSLDDISAISQLGGLVTLNLSNNRISDISPLASLASLRTLYLDNNPVTNLTAISSLSSLTSLSIKGIDITESELETLSKALPNCAIHSEAAQEESQGLTFGGVTFKSDVTELDLSNMGLRDISALSNCKYLKKLNLSGNEISDLSPLMDIPDLQWLDISYNYVSDLKPLMGVSDLYFLNASGNSITSTTALSMMTGLQELYLDSNPIRNFKGLIKLRRVTTMGLSSTGLDDDSMLTLSGLTALRNLYIEDNPSLSGEAVDRLKTALSTCNVTHSDLSYTVSVGGFPIQSDATELSLSSAGISDISGISELSKLETVQLSWNNISNIYYLEYSQSRNTIVSMDLSNNSLEDITALSSLKSIEYLDLRNNLIDSELPLMNLFTLKTLYIGGNFLSEEQLNNLRNSLVNCAIVVE